MKPANMRLYAYLNIAYFELAFVGQWEAFSCNTGAGSVGTDLLEDAERTLRLGSAGVSKRPTVVSTETASTMNTPRRAAELQQMDEAYVLVSRTQSLGGPASCAVEEYIERICNIVGATVVGISDVAVAAAPPDRVQRTTAAGAITSARRSATSRRGRRRRSRGGSPSRARRTRGRRPRATRRIGGPSGLSTGASGGRRSRPRCPCSGGSRAPPTGLAGAASAAATSAVPQQRSGRRRGRALRPRHQRPS